MRTIEEIKADLEMLESFGINSVEMHDRLIGYLEELLNYRQAERDGRCVVLPCKVGDKVKVDCRTWGNAWNFKKQGEFLFGEIISITKTRKQTLIKIQAEHHIEWKRERKRYPVSAIGKTVFLTKEEAEQALKGGEVCE